MCALKRVPELVEGDRRALGGCVGIQERARRGAGEASEMSEEHLLFPSHLREMNVLCLS